MKLLSAMKLRILLATALTAVFAGAARADVIMDWNAKADSIATENKILPAPHSRALSMLHIAMFEAVNAIERRYAPYKLTLSADRSTSKEPTAVPLVSTVGATTPWVMTSGSQFRPEPPPALDSETWTKDLNEIREIGGRNSTKRTAEQTTIGRFWFFVGARTYNPIVRQAAMAKNMDVVDCARLFALTSIAGNDAIVAAFDAKFDYNFWRPITAIRNADP